MRSFGINFEVENKDELSYLTRDALKTILLDKIQEAYDKRKETLGEPLLKHIERVVLLQMIDVAWKDNLYELDQLKKGIGYRAYAQKDPKIEYQKESFMLFDGMMKRIRETTIEYVFKVQVNVSAKPMPAGQENRNTDPTKTKCTGTMKYKSYSNWTRMDVLDNMKGNHSSSESSSY